MWAPLLLVLVLIGITALVYQTGVAVIGLLLILISYFGLLIGPWCWAVAALYSTREDSVWRAKDWLPLRGRWLCYLVCSLMRLPVLLFLFLFGVFILAFTGILS